MSSQAGPSKHMSVEEQARQKNISFWELNSQMEDAEAAELARDGVGDFLLEDANEDGDAITTTEGGDHTDVGGGDHTDGGGGATRMSVVATTRMAVVVVTRLLRGLRSRGRTGHRKRSASSQTRSLRSP